MREKVKRMVMRYGTQLCSLALVIAPVAATACHRQYYQPKEPEGMAEFIHAGKEARKDS